MMEEQQVETQEEQTHSEKYRQRLNPKIAIFQKEGVVVGTGDNKRIIPPDEVYKLAALHCSIAEISDWFNTTPKIITYNFADLIAKAKSETKQRLRAAMIENACVNKNATIQIFMAKNYLGMSDAPLPETTEGKEGVEFNVTVVDTKRATGTN